MPNLNANQVIAIVLVVLGVCVASTAQLTDLFGPHAAKTIVSVSGLLMSILSGVLGVITGQGSQIRAVQNMAGVDKILVNGRANETLASLAVDPTQQKIEPTRGSEQAVQTAAKGN
jgi:hypothetical protein